MTSSRAFIVCIGIVCATGGLVAARILSRDAVETSLLVALLWAGGVPAGATLLLAVMRLVPGPWRNLEPASRALALLSPVSLVAVAPLYFEGVAERGWLAGLIILFAGLGVANALCRGSAPLACVTLLIAPPAMTVLADLGLLARDSAESSGFGLYILNYCVSCAIAVAAIATIVSVPARGPAPLGALLLMALLLSVYFAFMPYIIAWSGNVPAHVLWFVRRGGGWSWLVDAAGLLQIGALLALFAPVAHRSGAVLAGLAAIALIGKLCEAAWIVYPAGGHVFSLPEIVGGALLAGACAAAFLSLAWALPEFPFRASPGHAS